MRRVGLSLRDILPTWWRTLALRRARAPPLIGERNAKSRQRLQPRH